MEKLVFRLLFLTIIVLDAIGDGFRDRALKTIAKSLKGLLLFILVGCMLFFQTLYWPVTLWPGQCVLLILAYAFIHFALYDVVYNIAIGYPYIFCMTGETWVDKICEKVINWLLTKIRFKFSRDFFLLMIRCIALVWGVVIIKWAF